MAVPPSSEMTSRRDMRPVLVRNTTLNTSLFHQVAVHRPIPQSIEDRRTLNHWYVPVREPDGAPKDHRIQVTQHDPSHTRSLNANRRVRWRESKRPYFTCTATVPDHTDILFFLFRSRTATSDERWRFFPLPRAPKRHLQLPLATNARGHFPPPLTRGASSRPGEVFPGACWFGCPHRGFRVRACENVHELGPALGEADHDST